MTIRYILIILINSLLVVTGQMLLKSGMDMEHAISFRAFFKPKIFFGLCLYIGTMITWLAVLPKVTFSVAYPFFNSTVYVLSMLAAIFILGEAMTVNKIIGSVLIVTGIVVIVQ